VKCKVCEHPERQHIEALRASGAGLDALAKKFDLHRDAVWRHWTRHVSSDLRTQYLAGPGQIEALKVKAVEEGASVLDYLVALRSMLMNSVCASAEAGSATTLATISGRLIECLREISRLTSEVGAMPGGVNLTISINAAAEFPALAEGLLDVARRFPDARQAIVGLLRSLDAAPSPKPNGAHQPMLIEGERHAP
jgi:hypothetical protein